MTAKHFLDDIDIGRVAAIAFDCFGTLCEISTSQSHPYRQLLQLLRAAGREPQSSDARTIMTSDCGLTNSKGDPEQVRHQYGHEATA